MRTHGTEGPVQKGRATLGALFLLAIACLSASQGTQGASPVDAKILPIFTQQSIKSCYQSVNPGVSDVTQYIFPPLRPRMATQSELWTAPVNDTLREHLQRDNIIHRKQWEFTVAVRAAKAAGVVKPGNSALCFAAGTERMPSVFASMGMSVLATDIVIKDSAWYNTKQQAHNVEDLYYPHIVKKEDFDRLVKFQEQNMNFPTADLQDRFDLVWTLCSVEHVGSIRLGQRFMLSSLTFLKPGGIAVHSMEFNLGSNDVTVAEGSSSLWRQKDVIEVIEDARRLGFEVQEPCWASGEGPADQDSGVVPHHVKQTHNHVKFRIAGYPCTSYAIIFKRPLNHKFGIN